MLDDFGGLLRWETLQEWIAAQPSIPGTGPVTAVTKLTGGSQNNIFRLEREGAAIILRRPPLHLRPNSNDTMLREARVLTAIAGTEVPHPEAYAACADTEVIGVCFYVMEPIDGFTPSGPLPGSYGSDPSWRRALAFEMVEAAARLSAVDPYAVGLEGFGKPDRWVERQVDRWRSQLQGYGQIPNYGSPELPAVTEVGDWLAAHLPSDPKVGIIHGDFQFANVMFSAGEAKLAAVVDWELSTLGDPLLDLGWMLTSWGEPGDPPGHNLAVEPWDGFPTRDELIEHYAKVSGRDVSDVSWYFVLACYKLGIILEGSYARSLAGQADADMGARLHEYALWLFSKAQQLISA